MMRNTADTLAIRGNAATISSACEVHSLELQGEQRRATLLLLNPNWSLVLECHRTLRWRPGYPAFPLYFSNSSRKPMMNCSWTSLICQHPGSWSQKLELKQINNMKESNFFNRSLIYKSMNIRKHCHCTSSRILFPFKISIHGYL